MTLDELKQKLKTDRLARIKYIQSAVEFFEANGVTVDEALLKSFDEDAIKAVTGGGGGGTNVIAIF
ncbi:hypothetical protein [Zoogloea sp.]|uniref:hypothetical protein n=1 Tax=Zoogloea sp. TaxID=49181 RepID=UPI0035B3A941